MSLLDLRETPAWTTVLHANALTRRLEYTRAAWLNNGQALAFAGRFGPDAKLYQWDGKAWTDVMASRAWRV